MLQNTAILSSQPASQPLIYPSYKSLCLNVLNVTEYRHFGLISSRLLLRIFTRDTCCPLSSRIVAITLECIPCLTFVMCSKVNEVLALLDE